MARERLTQKQWDMLKMLVSTGCPVSVHPSERRTAQLLVKKGWAQPCYAHCYAATERGALLVSKP